MGDAKDPNQMTIDEAHDALYAMLDAMETPPQEGTPPTGSGEAPVEEGNGVAQETAPDGEQPIEQPASQSLDGDDATTQPAEPTGAADPMAERFAKLEADIQRLRSENGRMRKIAADNAMLKRKLKAQAQQETPPEQRPRLSELTEEQEIQFGDEVAAVFKQKMAEADQMLEAMDERYRAQEAYLTEVREREHKTHHAAMMDAIERQYGEEIWDAMDTDAFRAWSENYDPVTGMRNHDLLAKIDANADSEAAIAIMGNFVRQCGVKVSGNSAPTANARSNDGAPASANVAQRPAESRGNAAAPTQAKKAPQQWTVKAAEAAYARADRDPAWANSKEGKAAFESIMNATLTGQLRL